MECEYFKHIVKYQIAVCRKCRHAVLPSHIRSHLQRVHKVKLQQAESIAERVGNWPGVAEYASEIAVPTRTILPIHKLLVYCNRFLCQLEPNCRQILQSIEAMRKH
jgi:hypothetical protein